MNNSNRILAIVLALGGVVVTLFLCVLLIGGAFYFLNQDEVGQVANPPR